MDIRDKFLRGSGLVLDGLEVGALAPGAAPKGCSKFVYNQIFVALNCVQCKLNYLILSCNINMIICTELLNQQH